MSDSTISKFMLFVMAILLGWFFYSQGWIFSDFKNVSSKEANYLIDNDKNLTLVDVRIPYEYKKGFIKTSVNVPLYQFEENLSLMEPYKDTKVLFYSERGDESMKAARLLSKHGYTILNLKGGIVFWIRHGFVLRLP